MPEPASLKAGPEKNLNGQLGHVIGVVNDFLNRRDTLLEQRLDAVLHGHARAGASAATAFEFNKNHAVFNLAYRCTTAMRGQRRSHFFSHDYINGIQNFLIGHFLLPLYYSREIDFVWLNIYYFLPSLTSTDRDTHHMTDFIANILKGALMGAANVIPGVSGGTMALLTGIFEKLINTIKSFDLMAVRLACRFRFKELFEHVDLKFLSAIGIGVVVSILSFARLLEYLFEHHALHVWAFFFGLILASVYFVGKKIEQRSASVIVLFLLGTAGAGAIAFLEPAAENASIPYLLVCGAIAMCSMILPGLSGSYVLLLMGNYQLVMIKAVAGFDLAVLIPVGIGAVAGLAAFARLLSWIFKKYHDQTIALLTGFIFGSLSILWPWKEAIIQTFQKGDEIKEKVVGYNYALPELTLETAIAAGIMIAGIVAIILVETAATQLKRD